MELIRVIAGQAIVLKKPRSPVGGPLPALHAVNALQERFTFLEKPTKLEDFDYGKGLLFKAGISESGGVIDRLQLHQNGVIVDAPNSTDFCEEVAESAYNCLHEALQANFESEPSDPSFYTSYIEVRLSLSASEIVQKYGLIGRRISQFLKSYKQLDTEDLEFYGTELRVGRDQSVPFLRLERSERKDAPVDALFSSASLRTEDHLEVVKLLESIFA